MTAQLYARPLASITPGERRWLLAGQAALAEALFDPSIEASEDPEALIRGLYWLTVNLARHRGPRGRRQPLAIAIDDAQWSDRSSLRFVAHLAARIEDLPVALLVAARTGEPSPCQEELGVLRRAPCGLRLVPAPLSEAGIAEVVEAELPGAEPLFVSACARVSGGNPFIAHELIHTLRDDGVTPDAAAVAQVEQLVPATCSTRYWPGSRGSATRRSGSRPRWPSSVTEPRFVTRSRSQDLRRSRRSKRRMHSRRLGFSLRSSRCGSCIP